MVEGSSSNTIVNRMRERLFLLQSEQAALQSAQEKLNQVQFLFKKASLLRNSQRRAYLNAIQSRHAVETELWNVKDRTETLRSEIVRNKEESALTAQELERVGKDWDEAMRGMYSKHQVRIVLYQRFVENHLRKKEERKNRRQNNINALARQAELIAQQELEMEEESRQLESELEVSESSDGDTMTETAEQIRKALQEVSLDLFFNQNNKSTPPPLILFLDRYW